MKSSRSTHLHVMVTPAEKQAMEAAAQSAGMSLSVWVRVKLIAAAKKEAKP
jgi:predicted HicB family RNase H-like nuclease